MTRTKLKDIFLPKNKDKRYFVNFVIELVATHMVNCNDCAKWYEDHWIDGEFKPYAKDKHKGMD